MDNKKVGKLIAKLRKEKGLTQQQLGDKVGVGFRAVSKWERGLTMPDIGIVNELSKILGISSDELLSGELKKSKTNNKKKLSLKLKVTISILISLILITASVLIYYNNKTYIHGIHSTNEEEYYIEGQVALNKGQISIIVNKLNFMDEDFSSIMIKNYEYYINLDNKCIFSYGYIMDIDQFEEKIKIKDFSENFRINYNGDTQIKANRILKSKFTILFKFIDENNNEILKEVEFSLYPSVEDKKK